MAKRSDDFPMPVKEALAKRVGYRCSVPDCRAATAGPHTNPEKSVNAGMAAHITAASMGGPRYDREMTSEQRKSAENGIWTCYNHGKIIDSDEAKYTVETLRKWKADAEAEADRDLGKTKTEPAKATAATLPERFRAPRPTPYPEDVALDLLWKHIQFYMHVVRLVESIGNLPNNAVIIIPRNHVYDERKAALLTKFGEKFAEFQDDFGKAFDLLEAAREATADADAVAKIDEILSAAREVATTVDEFYKWTEDKRNEPLNLGMIQERPQRCDAAREASKTMASLLAKTMMARRDQ